jgi:hypothetical protein
MVNKFNIRTISSLISIGTCNTNRVCPSTISIIRSSRSNITLRHICIFSIIYIWILYWSGPSRSIYSSSISTNTVTIIWWFCRCFMISWWSIITISKLIMSSSLSLFSISSP